MHHLAYVRPYNSRPLGEDDWIGMCEVGRDDLWSHDLPQSSHARQGGDAWVGADIFGILALLIGIA